MSFLNTIVEFEGPVVNVRARYWAAHREAVAAVNFQGPNEDDFWRLVRTGSPDGLMVQHGKSHHVAEYTRIRDERLESSDLMLLDTLQPSARENLKLLKSMGACHLVTLCKNRDGINATLDREDVWMFFDKKQSLPEDRERRVQAIKEITGTHRTLAVVSSVPMAYAAGEAGCRVVGVRSGPTFPKRLQQVGVDVFYDSLDQLTDAIGKRDPDLQRIGIL